MQPLPATMISSLTSCSSGSDQHSRYGVSGVSLLGWKLGSGVEPKGGTMGFHYWGNVLRNQSLSLYQVQAQAVQEDKREKRLLWAPTLEQMVWREPSGLWWPLRTREGTLGSWGQEEGDWRVES